MSSNKPTTNRSSFLPRPSGDVSSSTIRRYWGVGDGSPLPVSSYNAKRVTGPVYTGGEFVGGVHEDFLPVIMGLNHIMRQHDYVPINPGCWGGARRKVRGGSSWSTHAFLCAFDLSAPANPMSSTFRSDFPPAMVQDILAMTATGTRALTWGGYWSRADAMHFQANTRPSNMSIVRTPDGSTFGKGDIPSSPTTGTTTTNILKIGSKHPQVFEIQRLLILAELLPAGADDGAWGPQTDAAVKEWQKRLGLTADGLWGPVTERKTREWIAARKIAPAPAAPTPVADVDVAEGVLARAYSRGLGRGPDSQGKAHYMPLILSGQLGEGPLIEILRASAEGQEVAATRARIRVKELREAVIASHVEQLGFQPNEERLSVGIVKLGGVLDGLWS